MKAQLARGAAALVNLTLATLLMCMWVLWAVQHDNDHKRDVFDYLTMASLVATTITSTYAAFFLLRTRTFSVGVKWHRVVGWSLLTLIGVFVADNFLPGRSMGSDFWPGFVFFLLVWSAWPATGIFLRRLLSTNTTAHQPTLAQSETIAAPQIQPSISAVTPPRVEETIPLNVGRPV